MFDYWNEWEVLKDTTIVLHRFLDKSNYVMSMDVLQMSHVFTVLDQKVKMNGYGIID